MKTTVEVKNFNYREAINWCYDNTPEMTEVLIKSGKYSFYQKGCARGLKKPSKIYFFK
jgi:hypothetical protein